MSARRVPRDFATHPLLDGERAAIRNIRAWTGLPDDMTDEEVALGVQRFGWAWEDASLTADEAVEAFGSLARAMAGQELAARR